MTARPMRGTRGPEPDQPYEAKPETESFEVLFARLEEISGRLEEGGLSLEQSVDLYEEGMRLAQRCQDLLTNVEQRIETLRQRVLEPGDEPR